MPEVFLALTVIGFFVFLGVLIPSPWQWFARRALQRRHNAELDSLRNQHERDVQKVRLENDNLKAHLHTKMEIDADGMAKLKRENDKLKQMIQNLRISNQALSTAPEQAEFRLLRVYSRAIDLMERKFPVFIPSWRTVVAHVEKEMQQVDNGTAPLRARDFRPSSHVSELPSQNAKLLSQQVIEEHKD